MNKSEYSEEIAAKIDAQVREIISNSYQTAKSILEQNRIALEHLVDLLSDQETIEGELFRKIVAEHAQVADEKIAVSH
jgi:cell division protease FtsH